MGAPDCYKYFVDAVFFGLKNIKLGLMIILLLLVSVLISTCVSGYIHHWRSSVFAIFSLGSIRYTKCRCI